jgi:hypothetical protein
MTPPRLLDLGAVEGCVESKKTTNRFDEFLCEECAGCGDDGEARPWPAHSSDCGVGMLVSLLALVRAQREALHQLCGCFSESGERWLPGVNRRAVVAFARSALALAGGGGGEEMRRRERGGAPWTTRAEDREQRRAQRKELIRLSDALGALIADEDLSDEKLRAASESLLPNLADALMKCGFGTEASPPPDPGGGR